MTPAATGTVLHLDGGTRRLDATPFAQRAGWQEQPGSLADLTAVADASVEAVFASHSLERLYPHQVHQALQQCLRVLKPEGFLLLQCTDLKAAAKLIATDNYTTPVYQGPHGPMAAIDIVYGHRASIAAGHTELAHHCGFTGQSLMATLKEAGFQQIAARELPDQFDLWALGTKAIWADDALKATVAGLFPARS
jgi:ubiquinone/menaquinone biosynthesis C-methylase UbiE